MSRSDRARTAIVVVTLAASTFAYSFQLVSFTHAKLLVLAVGTAALAIAGLFAPRARLFNRYLLPIFALIAAAIGLHTVVHHRLPAVRDIVPIACLWLFAGSALDLLESEAVRRRVLDAIAWTAVVCAILAVGQFADLTTPLFPEYPGSGVYSVFGNSGLLGGFLALALPIQLMRYAESKRVSLVQLVSIAVVVAALLLSGARTAWLAAAAGCVVALWRTQLPAVRMLALAACLAAVSTACVLAAPESTVERLARSFTRGDTGANLRWWFWLGAARVIEDYPVTGIGLGRFQYWAAPYLGEVLWSPGGERLAHNILHVEHPHNEYLAVVAELGLPGVAAMVAAAVILARRRGPEWPALAALFVFGFFNAPFHSVPHSIAGLLLALGLILRTSDTRSAVAGRARLDVSRYAAVAAAVAVLVGVVIAVVAPSHRLAGADIASTRGEDALERYKTAAAGPFFLPEAHERYGAALLRAGRYADARDTFTLALKHLDWGSVYLGLAAAEHKLGNRPAARVAAERCVRRWPSHADAWRILLSAAPTADHAEIIARAQRFGVLLDRDS